jgi:hypothetical protein
MTQWANSHAWLRCRSTAAATVIATLAASLSGAAWGAPPTLKPKFSEAVAYDVSVPLRDQARLRSRAAALPAADQGILDIRPDRGPVAEDRGHSGDGARQNGFSSVQRRSAAAAAASIAAPLANFEGLSNQDNFNLFGFRVNPPDPAGAVGPNHYVEMTNLAYAVYDKQGNLLLGPADTGTLWSGFPIEDCTDPSGDPIVIYDRLVDRWLLTQFTTRGPKYYSCVAISKTGDPTGAYYRYAFVTQPDPDLPGGTFFPDYPKYGVWTNSYLLTTRDFGDLFGYGISVYALEKNKMLAGNPKARAVQFFLDSSVVPVNLMGDGLLPADIDGQRRPLDHVAAPIVGTQDAGAFYGAGSDALNIWDLSVKWNATPEASLTLATQLPVAEFDSVFPCPGGGRRCLPQPGVLTSQYIDILSYRQRPTNRLAYRNFGTHEALVTNQSVEAAPGVAGVRWYEIRRHYTRPDKKTWAYTVHQQGTFAPGDGVHRWMGSAAMDAQGNIALGYSVVNGVDVFPGIRYTGRLAGDPLGLMTLGEGTIINGSGVQRSINNRWGDYTALNIDPVDDCTFWYVNQYYTLAGQLSSTVGWQTRIASFKLPGCVKK